ncbi:unnamed protein product [Sphagnum tenellum]
MQVPEEERCRFQRGGKQIPEGSEAGCGWKEMQIPEWKEADSKVKWTPVPEGKGCRFQRGVNQIPEEMDAGRFRMGKGCRFQRESDGGSRRKGVQVPAQKTSESSCIFRNCKNQGISLLVYSTQKVVE